MTDPNVQLTDQEKEALFRVEIENGDNAKRLLQDAYLARWFKECEDSLWGDFQATPSSEMEKLSNIKAELDALTRLHDKLTEAADTSMMAREQLKELQNNRIKVKSRQDRQLADFDAVADYSGVTQ